MEHRPRVPPQSARSPRRLPQPSALAALGAVLCLYRTPSGSELAGWSQAVRTEACSEIDSDGLRESLDFYDADGRCCWQLYLLPDSDFLAWERLTASLPLACAPASGGIAERLWRRLAQGMRAAPWQASVLRLRLPPIEPGHAVAQKGALAASLATVSELGAAVAARIARSSGVERPGLLHDCCCERAAHAAARLHPDPDAASTWSPIQLNKRLPT
jgi:hypothetical protein